MCEHMKKAVIILGHGSKRQEANAELDKIVESLAERHADWLIQKAYAEFAEPTREQAVGLLARQGIGEIVLVPFFLTLGNHLHKNLPDRMKRLAQIYPEVVCVQAEHLGCDTLLVQLIEKRIAEADER